MSNIMDAISVPKKFLTFLGHWPGITPSILQRVLVILDNMFVLSLLLEVVIHSDDYELWPEYLSILILLASTLIKLVIFKFKYNDVQELIHLLELREFNDYPKELSSIVDGTVKFIKYLGNVFQLGCLTTISIYCLLPLFTRTNLPVRLSYDVGRFKPFLYALQVMAFYSAGIKNSSLDLLAVNLMGMCAAQIEILNRKIKSLTNCGENIEIRSKDINDFLKSCVKQHVQIIGYHEILEEVFSLIFLTQYATSAAVISNIGFHLVRPASFRFVHMMIFFIAVLIQLVIYCWFGNEIIVKSLAVEDACYECPWFESDYKARKTLTIIMERSKRPLFLTAGKFMIVSLQSFTSVIRTSYSYFALLQTLYGKNKD